MSQRLTRIVTKKGDKGFTSLADGTRVEKNSPRIEVLGAVDELNSWIGALAAFCRNDTMNTQLRRIQNDLFDLGSGIALPNSVVLSEKHVSDIDEIFELFHRDLEPQKEFILPGGSEPAALSHIARSVCRRAERAVLSLQDTDNVQTSFALPYLNRLSDVLFELARVNNRVLGIAEVHWHRQ